MLIDAVFCTPNFKVRRDAMQNDDYSVWCIRQWFSTSRVRRNRRVLWVLLKFGKYLSFLWELFTKYKYRVAWCIVIIKNFVYVICSADPTMLRNTDTWKWRGRCNHYYTRFLEQKEICTKWRNFWWVSSINDYFTLRRCKKTYFSR